MTHDKGSISIVMATHDSMRYITEQLDSLRTQTLSPDEVIIADNCSTDGTYEHIQEYISRYGLTNWSVYQNDHDIGIVQNFRNLLAKCSGEYIFTCDHDDVWMPDKLSEMVSVMKARPEIMLLVSNYILWVNGKNAKVHLPHGNRNDGTVMQIRFQDSYLSTLRPGCVYCFRAELLKKFNVLAPEGMLYDALLWKCAILSDSLYLLNRQLIYYRRHEHVSTGAYLAPIADVIKLRDSDGETKMYREFLSYADELEIKPEYRELMQEKIDFLQRRRKIREKKNLFSTSLFVLRNMKYYPTLRNALSDIYAAIFLK